MRSNAPRTCPTSRRSAREGTLTAFLGDTAAGAHQLAAPRRDVPAHDDRARRGRGHRPVGRAALPAATGQLHPGPERLRRRDVLRNCLRGDGLVAGHAPVAQPTRLALPPPRRGYGPPIDRHLLRPGGAPAVPPDQLPASRRRLGDVLGPSSVDGRPDHDRLRPIPNRQAAHPALANSWLAGICRCSPCRAGDRAGSRGVWRGTRHSPTYSGHRSSIGRCSAWSPS